MMRVWLVRILVALPLGVAGFAIHAVLTHPDVNIVQGALYKTISQVLWLAPAVLVWAFARKLGPRKGQAPGASGPPTLGR